MVPRFGRWIISLNILPYLRSNFISKVDKSRFVYDRLLKISLFLGALPHKARFLRCELRIRFLRLIDLSHLFLITFGKRYVGIRFEVDWETEPEVGIIRHPKEHSL